MNIAAVWNFRDSGAPQLIERLAPVLYKTDRLNLRSFGEGDSDWGESAAVSALIGQLVIKAPEFSAEVKEWAKQHINNPRADIIMLGRLFWETNQEALQEKRFGEVVVPPATVFVVPEVEFPGNQPAATTPAPPLNSGTKVTPKHTVLSLEEPPVTAWWKWLLAGLGVLLPLRLLWRKHFSNQR